MKTKQNLINIMIVLFVAIFLSSCGKSDTQTTPEVKNVTDAVFASGFITYSDEYWVTAVAEGFVLQAYVAEGSQVAADVPLFQLSNEVQSLQANNALVNYQDALAKASPNSPQLLQLKNQITQAEKILAFDKQNLDRYTKLLETHAVSQLDFDKAKLQYDGSLSSLEVLKKSLTDLENNLKLQVENAQNQVNIQNEYFDDYLLSSALPGIVLEVNKNMGELAKKGELLARIGAGRLITKLYIAEEDINRVALGQRAVLALNTDVGRTFEAVVSNIYPAFDDKEQSFVIEVSFTENLPTLRSGTQVQANIVSEERDNALIIPTNYLTRNNSVFLENNTEVPLEIGVKNSEWAEVLSGIDENTTIVLPKSE